MAMLTGGMNFVEASVPLLLIVTAQRMGAWVGARSQRRFSFGQVIVGVELPQALL